MNHRLLQQKIVETKINDLKEIGTTLKKMGEELACHTELADKTGETTPKEYQLEKMPRAIFPSREYLKQFIQMYMQSACEAGNDLDYTHKRKTVNTLLISLCGYNYQYYANKYERKVTEKYSDLYVE